MSKLNSFPLLYRLTKKDLKYVANNFALTKHARKRLDQRFDKEAHGSITKAIITSPLGYVSNDGTISIGTTDGSTFKFAQPKEEHHKFLMITFYEPSLNKKDIWKKYKLTLRGHNR